MQVVRYDHGTTIVLRHIGSSSRMQEIARLHQQALEWIGAHSGQQSFFPLASSFDPILSQYRYLGVKYTLLYDAVRQGIEALGFVALNDPLLLDLVLMRVVEPASKRHSIQLLSSYFGISREITTVYRRLPQISSLKDQAESLLVSFARKHLHFDFSFVLYDVTTLYFESFTTDELRTCGFSKDNKANQPQVVVGLLVNTDGFPLSYDVFSGRTFEGHTIIPVITALVRKYAITSLTVVADAAMLSEANIAALEQAKVSYIVGARLGYLSRAQVDMIATTLQERDQATIRTPYAGHTLVCDFSSSRYTKDKRDTETYVAKAQAILDGKTAMKRHRFLSGTTGTYTLNQPLIDRTKRLWGIKGYVTNVDIPDAQIITAYRNLWRVEQSFRMAKSDLLTRPVYHTKEKAIKAHLLICILALAVGKYLEWKSHQSLKHMIETFKAIPDARIVNKTTGEETGWRAELPDHAKQVLTDLGVTY